MRPARRLGDLRPSGPPALVSEEGFIAVQGIRAEREGADPRPQYQLAGLLRCGICGRRAESRWSNNRPPAGAPHGRSLGGRRHEIQRYRLRVGSLFAGIERWRDPGSDETHWRSTDNHVIAGATSITVTEVGNGRTYRAGS